MNVKIGECKICGAPILSEALAEFPSPVWSCGHFQQQVSIQVNH
jgi:hypothetical protein